MCMGEGEGREKGREGVLSEKGFCYSCYRALYCVC